MSNRPAKFRSVRPPPHLSNMVKRPGGLLRDVAIARGEKVLEAQRASAQAAILDLIDTLEAMTTATALQDREGHMLLVTDQLIALATLFSFAPQEKAGKRLSELLVIFHAHGTFHAEAVAVHLRAMRLMLAAPSDTRTVAAMLEELDVVLAHIKAKAPQVLSQATSSAV